jgi:glycosyltransferase involved in cell wall biosynthesis
MMAPIVSVVMPVWNGERFLEAAIESVLSQTFRDLELVVVDDGSDDCTAAIITRYAEADPRVKPLFGPHRGLVETLNSGCEVAQGKYIARLDYDDIALADRLEQQIAFLESRPRVALLGTAFQYITARGCKTSVVVSPPLDDVTIRERLRKSNLFCHSAVMMRSEVFHQLGGYRLLYTDAEDYDLWLRFADEHELANLPTVLVMYRIHPSQISLIRLERQALVSLAARTSAEIKRRTGIDPLAEHDAIDELTLAELGISEQEVHAQLVSRYLTCLSWMPQIGFATEALNALRDVAIHHSLLKALE